jgi:DNA-binding transcriptional MerR regulator/quercetin dioxygenase-like cupin family protein
VEPARARETKVTLEVDEAAASVFKIAEVAQRAGISASTLRLWERQGLIVPGRSATGHRQYSAEDIVQAKRIAWYRSERGLNPAAIREALEAARGAGSDPEVRVASARSEIGRKLRALRRAAGQTLDEVARAVGAAPSVISTLERTSHGVSFRLLHILAEHFGTTVSRLSGEARGARDLVPAETWQSWPATAPGVTVQQLAEGQRSMDCHRFVLAAGASSEGAYSHEGEEFLHVLSGGIEVVLDGDAFHVLRPGDSLYFDSRRPHSWCNHHDGETILLWINTPPTF